VLSRLPGAACCNRSCRRVRAPSLILALSTRSINGWLAHRKVCCLWPNTDLPAFFSQHPAGPPRRRMQALACASSLKPPCQSRAAVRGCAQAMRDRAAGPARIRRAGELLLQRRQPCVLPVNPGQKTQRRGLRWSIHSTSRPLVHDLNVADQLRRIAAIAIRGSLVL